MPPVQVVVIGDWDLDGMVSAAQIVYAQEFRGAYPLKEKCQVMALPTSTNAVQGLLPRLRELATRKRLEALAIVDLAYNERMEKFLREVRGISDVVVFIDHHISSYINSDKIEKSVNEVLLGRGPTALLIYNMLRSIHVNVTARLETFVNIVARIEGRKVPVNRSLTELAVKLSRFMTYSKDERLWTQAVRWLASPIVIAALPFTPSIDVMLRKAQKPPTLCDIEALAKELALGAVRIFNYRVVRVGGEVLARNCKITTLVSALYRALKSNVVLYACKDAEVLVAIRTRDSAASKIMLELYRRGLIGDVIGHYTFSVAKLREPMDFNSFTALMRELILKYG